MELDKLRELVGLFEKSDLSELEIEEEGRRIRLMKAAPQQHVVHAPQHVITHMPAVAPLPVPQAAVPMSPVAAATQAAPAAEAEVDESLVTIESPMVGVFYACPAPGEPPFIKAGDTVEENQTVCIVEAMKLMNEVTAKFKCTVVQVLVENGEPVEYNQPLFAVRVID